MLRVYLDTNVYCRPRDDRTQERIDAEARAFEEIARMKEAGEVVVITSDYVKMELKEIDDPEKREDVMNFERAVSDMNYVHSRESKDLALALSKRCGLGILDSLHLSAAALSGAECFLTCDDEVIKKSDCIASELAMEILNPVVWRTEVDSGKG